MSGPKPTKDYVYAHRIEQRRHHAESLAHEPLHSLGSVHTHT